MKTILRAITQDFRMLRLARRIMAGAVFCTALSAGPIVPLFSEDGVAIDHSEHIGQHIMLRPDSIAVAYFEDWLDGDYNDMAALVVFGELDPLSRILITVQRHDGLTAYKHNWLDTPEGVLKKDGAELSWLMPYSGEVPFLLALYNPQQGLYHATGTANAWVWQSDAASTETPEPTMLLPVGVALMWFGLRRRNA
jgi:hypothetical protein